MPVICPKCSHVRPANATNPDWECPACGVCYAKFGDRGAAPSQSPIRSRLQTEHDQEVDVKQSWNLGLLAKIILLTICGWGINKTIEHHRNASADQEIAVISQLHQDHSAATALADAALKAAPADVSMLRNLAGRLEESCARNKYGLSEPACVARIRAYGDECATATARRYPNQMSDTRQMALVTQAYVACIFES